MEEHTVYHVTNRELRRAERHREDGPWKVPVASPYDVAFAIKAANRPRPSGHADDLRALAALGAAGQWLSDDDLRTIAATTQTPLRFLRESVSSVNRWLAGIEDYVARCDALAFPAASRAGQLRGRGGVSTALVLAGDDIFLAPWAMTHCILAGTRCVAVSVRPEPLSPFRFVRAALEAGVVACPELVYLDRDSETDQKSLRTLLDSTRQSVVFGGDRFVTATYGAAPGVARHRATPYWNGRCTALVLPDADVDLAAEMIVSGAVEGRGNRCLSTKKVLVPAGEMARALEERLVACAERLRRGEALDPTTDLSPPDPAARRAGEAVAARGELLYDRDLLMVRCSAGASLLKEDLSCPMLIVAHYGREDEAIAAANMSVADSDAGAATVVSVFTGDDAAFERAASQLLAFKVRRNRPTSEFDLNATHQGRHLYLELMRRMELGG